MRLLPALAAALLLAPAPAHAADYQGGCGYDGVRRYDTFTGVLYATVAAPRAAVTTVTCYVVVDWVEQPHTRLMAGGIGVTVGTRAIEFTATDVQDVELCEFVEFADEPGVVHGQCGEGPSEPLPPQVVIDVLTPVFGTVDATLCRVFAAQAGTYGDVLTIREHGDVYVDGELFWDCPPYEEW